MSGFEVEKCLAALYTHADLRQEFLHAPDQVLARFELTDGERDGLLHIDKVGLVVAGNCYGAKRAKYIQWMHALALTVQSFERLVATSLLKAAAEEMLAYRASHQRADAPAAIGQAGVYDFLDWDTASSYSLDCLLQEQEGLSDVLGVWSRLKTSPLKNHHLLRCLALSVSEAGRGMNSHHDRPGAYMTYLCMPSIALAPATEEVVLRVANDSGVTRKFSLKPENCVIVPAHMSQGFDEKEGEPALAPQVLVFKSLAAVE